MNATYNMQTLRDDTLQSMERRGIKQRELCRMAGIAQPNMSFFLSGRRGLSFESAVKLWPFVYGAEFPQIPRAAPVGEPERGAVE